MQPTLFWYLFEAEKPAFKGKPSLRTSFGVTFQLWSHFWKIFSFLNFDAILEGTRPISDLSFAFFSRKFSLHKKWPLISTTFRHQSSNLFGYRILERTKKTARQAPFLHEKNACTMHVLFSQTFQTSPSRLFVEASHWQRKEWIMEIQFEMNKINHAWLSSIQNGNDKICISMLQKQNPSIRSLLLAIVLLFYPCS